MKLLAAASPWFFMVLSIEICLPFTPVAGPLTEVTVKSGAFVIFIVPVEANMLFDSSSSSTVLVLSM